MKSFRFYLDVDAKDRDAAFDELQDMAGGMSFGDLEIMEMPSEQMSSDEILKYFKIDDKYQIYEKVIDHFGDYDGLLCRHCSASVGNDAKEMLSHLQQHTKKELEEDEN